MVGPRVYHIKHARSYPAFTAEDPAKVMDLATKWLNRHDFRIRRKNRQYSRGSKRGIHVNFVPKFKLYIEQGTNGQYVVRFDYYAKIKLGTAVVVGVLTSGISTVVGVGTLAVMLSDADHFVDKFWKHIDSLAKGNPVILTMERWASDGKGNFVKQPAPAGPVAVAAMPGPQVNPSLVKRQSQSNPAHVVPAANLPQPAHQMHPSQLPQQPQYGPGPHHMPAHGQYGPPMQQHPSQLYYPPPPPQMPQQVAPPRIEPGQVYGHNALRTTQSLHSSVPPAPLAYPPVASPPPHANSAYANGAPQHHSAYPGYPPTNAPHQHAYPPPHHQHPSHSMPPPNSGHPPYNAYPIGSQHDHPSHRDMHHSMPPALNNGHPPPMMANNQPPHSYAQGHHPAPQHSSVPPVYHSSPAPPIQEFARTSLHDKPTPISSQHSHNPPAPVSSQRTNITNNNNNNPVTSQHRPSSPTSSQRSNYPPPPAFVAPSAAPSAALSKGYPSPPSARNSHAPASRPTTAYPPPPTPHASAGYPPAPSVLGSGASDTASHVSAQTAYFQDLSNRHTATSGDKPIYKGEQQAKNVNRMSQYDLRSLPGGGGSIPAGDKSVIDQNTSSSYHDFNYAASDAQSLRKSGESFNPWDSNALAAARKDTLAQGNAKDANGLYPQLQRTHTPSGLPKH